MSTIYLIPHADAGEPWQYPKDDNDRPLTRNGREQAQELVQLVGDFGIKQIFSSWADRCQQTVQQLQRLKKIPVETSAMLNPNRGTVIESFMRTLPQETLLVCTHGENIYAFLKAIADDDKLEIPKSIKTPAGSCFVVERSSTAFTGVVYVPPGAAIPSPSKLEEENDEWIS